MLKFASELLIIIIIINIINIIIIHCSDLLSVMSHEDTDNVNDTAR